MQTLRNVLRLAAPYGYTKDRWYAWVMLSAVIGFAMGIVQVGVYLNHWNKRFYDALARYDAEMMPNLILEWIGFIAITVIFVICGSWLQKRLFLDWREHLTDLFERRWLKDHSQYRIKLRNEPDNPDQRIQEDCAELSERTIVLVKYFIMNAFKLIAFSSILWGLSGVQHIEFMGIEWEINGYLVWVALLWSVLCTIATHLIGRKLKPLNVARQHREADFRTTLLRVRDGAEQVASLRGEATELDRFRMRFSRIKENWLALIKREFQLESFTASYLRINNLISVLAGLPLYLTHAMTFGDLMQARSAFSSVQDGFGWFTDYYKRIMEWAAVVERLHGFDESLQAVQSEKVSSDGVETGNRVEARELSLFTPMGKCLSKGLSLSVKPGEWILIDGRSGAGKSTFLRALAGLWPFCQGGITVPQRDFLFIPQKSYLPFDTLTDVLTYPRRNEFPKETVSEVLTAVGLERLVSRLEEKKDWSQELSGGEQQRLGFARVLLNRPAILFLDEATNQLDDHSSGELLSLIKKRLPYASVLIVTHQLAVKASVNRKIEIGCQSTFAI